MNNNNQFTIFNSFFWILATTGCSSMKCCCGRQFSISSDSSCSRSYSYCNVTFTGKEIKYIWIGEKTNEMHSPFDVFDYFIFNLNFDGRRMYLCFAVQVPCFVIHKILILLTHKNRRQTAQSSVRGIVVSSTSLTLIRAQNEYLHSVADLWVSLIGKITFTLLGIFSLSVQFITLRSCGFVIMYIRSNMVCHRVDFANIFAARKHMLEQARG